MNISPELIWRRGILIALLCVGTLAFEYFYAKRTLNARRLGLLDSDTLDYSLADVKDEFDKAACPIDPDAMLAQKNPVWYLVETWKISDHGLETFIEILFHSDLDEERKTALLDDALSYLDGKGYYSFRLHSPAPARSR